MNVHSRTLSLPGAARPIRERGASALDRSITVWPAPDPCARVLDMWGAPTGPAVVRTGLAPWPAPNPMMRVEFAPPELRVFAPIDLVSGRAALVEPRHPLPLPDLRSASVAAFAVPPTTATQPPPWPPPVPESITRPKPFAAADGHHRSGIRPRLVVGLAAAAGALAAGVAALISLF